MQILTRKSKTSKYPVIPRELLDVPLSDEFLNIMGVELIQEFKAFVFGKKGDVVKMAAVNPNMAVLKKFAKDRFDKNVEWFSMKQSELDFVLKNCIRDFKTEINNIVSRADGRNGHIVDIVDKIIVYAISRKASDVHIEPYKNGTFVRFRMDGVLHKIFELPRKLHTPLVARFKILANLKIDEYRRPQDGRIEPEGFSDTSLRVSIVPVLHGEKIVLRILDDTHKNLSIESLGFSKEHTDIIMRNIEKPFGMIVASGPTGSGKTTMLYALLGLLKKDGINISTLEDPIEFALDGVNQIHVRPSVGLTFSSGLRSLLRQDPDIIMVGEIRDSDTIIMASEAALTGHLVLTTLHTNDAASALVRFLEMKVDDFVASSIVNLVIAQRLVRKVCPGCAKKEKLQPLLLEKIAKRDDVVDVLKKNGVSMSQLANLKFAVGAGCDDCLGTGYQDRMGIFEVLETNKEISDLILSHTSADRIKSVAEKNGFKNILQDGVDKVFSGLTTFEEVLRSTKHN